MSRQQPTWLAATFAASLAAYFIGAPAVSFVLGSWWPMLLGVGGLLGVVCILVAASIVQAARHRVTVAKELKALGVQFQDCSLCGTPVLYGPSAEVPRVAICSTH